MKEPEASGRTQSGDSKPAASATRWSMVHAAGDVGSPRHTEALEDLGRRYWQPLYSFARRFGRSPEDASDLTQGFLCDFLKRNAVAVADPARGRFRTFLLTCFKNYLMNEQARAQTARRGGGCEVVAIDVATAEERYAYEPVESVTPDQVFDRQCALTTLERALAAVRVEYSAAGKQGFHDELRFLLWEDKGEETYSCLGARLGMTEAAVKMAVVRLRRRCRQALLHEIAGTVLRPEDVEDEYRHLIAALRA